MNKHIDKVFIVGGTLGNRIDGYKQIVEVESLLENITSQLSVLDKKADSQVLRFLESRRESLIKEQHQLEIELVENTWIEKSTTFKEINNKSKYS